MQKFTGGLALRQQSGAGQDKREEKDAW